MGILKERCCSLFWSYYFKRISYTEFKKRLTDLENKQLSFLDIKNDYKKKEAGL